MDRLSSHSTKGPRLLVVAVMATLALLVGGCDWRGPNPTEAALAADTGPFADRDGHGRVGARVPPRGTIYYPTDTSVGRFGGVAAAPGFTGSQSAVSWYGPRLASHGFVVITIDTNSGFDFPASRGTQLLAALDYLTTASPVANRVDPARLAVMGHSMGGGGALEAARTRPSLRAAVPLAPWHTTKSWSSLTVPTLVVGCEEDGVAPVGSHAEAFYGSIPATVDKAYLEIDGGSHSCVTSPNDTIARSVISFLKHMLDGDTRYTPFLCPHPAVGGTVSDSRSTCPF